MPTERTGRLLLLYDLVGSTLMCSSTCLFCHAWGTTG